MKKSILLSSLIGCLFSVSGQSIWVDSLNTIEQANVININTQQRVFKIVHIGDSHIQADLFSGQVRRLLQQKYGNAGTGLVFPYRQINTNPPTAFSTSGAVKFAPTKITRCKELCGVGLAAYNAQMPANSMFTVSLKNDTGLQYISALFQSNNSGANICINQDTDTASYQMQDAGDFMISSYNKQVLAPFTIKAQETVNLYGLIVSNGQNGVLYYTIGANGATFSNYNNSTLFFEQLKTLQPDLIIVSLGTNESVSDITPEKFTNQLDSFNTNLLNVCQQQQIIYTTPADNYTKQVKVVRKKVKGKWRKKRVVYFANNTKLEELRDAMLQYCITNKVMYWDLYSAMGGDTSMKSWVGAGLAAKDHIHFNKAGYQLQGELFFRALLKILAP